MVGAAFALQPGVLAIAQQTHATGATAVDGTVRGNAACRGEEVPYNPSQGEDIVLPNGFKVQVFARDLNFPTAIAFMPAEGNSKKEKKFNVVVLESGTGLPGRCNNNELPAFGGKFSRTNPFTPDIVVFDGSRTNQSRSDAIKGPIGKPGSSNGSFQADGPAIGLAFRDGFEGGTLFGTDSNQGVRGAPGAGNNTSRVVTVDLDGNAVNSFISGLPTGDHPTEQILVKDGFIFWSQGSATNSGVTGHDNGAGGNQHDIPCQDIVLSNNLFGSGDGHLTSGFSNHNQRRPGQTVKAFEGATPGLHACTGAILRAKIDADNPASTVEPFSSGYRNPFGIRFSPKDHPLQGKLFVTENGEDERGSRPTNFAPDRLAVSQMNPDGTPDFHGWPDQFGSLDSQQAVFNPQGGPGDDECGPPSVPGSFPACIPVVKANHTPVRHVLAFPPQPVIAPLALEPADVADVGPDFAPGAFVGGVVKKGAALVAREGDLGFSPPNGVPNIGHDIELVNFMEPLQLMQSRFAFNCRQSMQTHLPDGSAACRSDTAMDTGEAFAHALRGINRPVTLMFGPDKALYLVDYGAVRDFGQADAATKFNVPADAPLVQIPQTGTIWKITRVGAAEENEDHDSGGEQSFDLQYGDRRLA